MLQFARQATDLVCNFEVLLNLADSANISVHGLSEEAPQAPAYAIHVLRHLRTKSLAGTLSAVVTLGRRGAVVAAVKGGAKL